MNLKEYLQQHPKKYLIFDLDETLVHLILPWPAYAASLKHDLVKLDGSLYSQWEQKKGKAVELENIYVRAFGETAKKLFIEKRQQFEEGSLERIEHNVPLIPMVRELTAYRCAIWSSNMKKTIKRALTEVGLDALFTQIVSMEDVMQLKREIDGFNLLYDKREAKKDYLFVGDSLADKMAAAGVGIDFFQINYFNRV